MSNKKEQIDRLLYEFEVNLTIDKKGKVSFKELDKKITNLRIEVHKIL